MRERSVRPFPVIAAVIIGLSGLVWFVLVALPNAAALREMLSILPIATAPRNIEGFIRDIVTYVSVNDGVARLARPLIVGAVAGLLIVVVDLALRSRRPATSERAVAEPAGGLTDGSPPMSGPTRVALVGLLWVVFGLLGVAAISYQPNRYVVPVLPGLALLAGAGMAVVAARTAGRALPIRAAALASVVILLAAPGIAVDGEWVASTGHNALDGQAAVERLVPAGATVAGGYAPLFAMRSPVVTAILFEGTSMNARDLYADGVRWAIEPRGLTPVWVAEHPAAWAARRELWCIDWGRSARPVCLSELP